MIASACRAARVSRQWRALGWRAFASSTDELQRHGVLSWGCGSQGALGLTNNVDQFEPEHIQHDLLPEDVAAVGAGHYTSFAVTSEGHLWSWGRSKEGQLGRPVREGEREAGMSAAPALVHGLIGQKVVSATGSAVVSFAVTAEGTVYSWGSSSRGQLGQGPGKEHSPTPQRVKGVEGVVAVSAGWGHACALTASGELYSWGWPANGRLGHSFAAGEGEEGEEDLAARCAWEPRRVDLLRAVRLKQVACGSDFTAALAQDGTLLTFGDNSLAQLGRPSPPGGESVAPLTAAAWLVNPEASCGQGMRFNRVAAGLAHCLAVGQEGSLLSWGWNSEGQLGLGQFVQDVVIARPTPIYGVPSNRFARIAAGRVHSVLVTDDVLRNPSSVLLKRNVVHTMCFSWGSATNGRLGTGMYEDALFPELLPDIDGDVLEDVACGLDHTLVRIRL